MKLLTEKAKKRIIIYLCFLFVGVLAFSCIPFVQKPVKADYVTDYIGVKVGYAGRELSDYVLVADYHISEIESRLPVYQYAYSFFSPNSVNPAKYNYVVDSARGILVRDLLDLANIYYGDIYNLNFYVQDHNGMWCAFDRDSLFAGNRYYFNNLPGHRKIKYKTWPKKKSGAVGMYTFLAAGGMEPVRIGDPMELIRLMEAEDAEEEDASKEEPSAEEPPTEAPTKEEPSTEEPPTEAPTKEEPPTEEPPTEAPSKEEPTSKTPEEKPSKEDPEEEDVETDYSVILGYDFSECWSDCSVVPAMLAIEDNWATFNEEFESAGPNFTTLNTGSRFRLLYGQFSPTDSNTRDSAKYVRYVYVTLSGAPKFEEPKTKKPLKTKVGSTDTIEFEVSDVYNEDMVEMLTKYMSIFSTDTNVIEIDKVDVKKVAAYSDKAMVEVTYKVVGEGEAAIGGTFGSYNGNPDADGAGITFLTDPVKTEEAGGGNTPLPDPEKETAGRDSGKQKPQKQEEESKPAVPGQSGEDDGNSNRISGDDKNTNIQKEEGTADSAVPPEQDDAKLNQPDGKVAEADIEAIKNTAAKTYVYQLSDELVKKLEGLQEDEILEPISPVTEEVQQLELEERSEEEKERRRLILMWTGIGCLAVCAAGGAAEWLSFRLRLKKRTRRTS